MRNGQDGPNWRFGHDLVYGSLQEDEYDVVWDVVPDRMRFGFDFDFSMNWLPLLVFDYGF